MQAFVPVTDRAPVAVPGGVVPVRRRSDGAEQVKGSRFGGVGVERQFQQRQRELEQPQQQQQLCASRSFQIMMLSEKLMATSASLFSYEQLYRAYLDCRKTKRNTPDALRFELNAEELLDDLQRELTERAYHPSTSLCFAAQKPKLREIFAADFRDRILHHLVVRQLERLWEPVFIYDSYASRPQKGIHLAVERLQTFCRQATRNRTQPAWYAQLDIRNFFMSIDKHRLFALLRSRCDQEELLWLTATLLFHDPTGDYHLRSPRWLLNRIPRQKSLFGVERGHGLPIGNLTSQFFANVYLNGLDQFVKHTLKCRYYLRYVDDFVLLHPDRSQLVDWRQQIEHYLHTQLELALHPTRRKLRPVANGIDFLGYIVRPDYILCRQRVVNNLNAKLRGFQRQLVQTQGRVTAIRYSHEVLEALLACLNSYLGHFRHADTFKLRHSLLERNRWLAHFFRYRHDTLTRLYAPPRGFRNLHAQYTYFYKRYDRFLLFFQVGCFYEFYKSQARRAKAALQLTPLPPKFGFRARCGIGVKGLDRYVERALQQGHAVVVVKQTGFMLPHVAERRVAVKYVLARPECPQERNELLC
jgi:RNA-directed DNA polymerase